MKRAVVLLSVLAVAGCGSDELPPPATPGRAPAQAPNLPGEVVPVRSELAEPFALGGLIRANTVGIDGGERLVSLDRRARRLSVYTDGRARPDSTVAAGLGPASLAADGDRVYVTDAAQNALLVFRLRPQLELQRRVSLPGRPYGVAVDRKRNHVWVTLVRRNELLRLTADGAARPGPTYPTVRRPLAVAVNPVSGAVGVRGGKQVQILFG